jgi:hypothetical protein
MVLAITVKNEPSASNATNRPIVNRGNARIAIPTKAAKAAGLIFQNLVYISIDIKLMRVVQS